MSVLPSPRLALALALAVTGCTDDENGPDLSLGALPDGETVARVEVAQYVGTWYELASIPMGFQASCTATTATYEVLDAQTVSVHNACRWGGLDGNPLDIDGTATIVDPASNARLEVDFGFAKSPYWIVDLGVPDGDEPYPWAVVSTPDRNSLWVLSRTAQVRASRYDAIIARLEERGFDPARMQVTEQP
jgi:apolipoprotein D and lipocalin family protein